MKYHTIEEAAASVAQTSHPWSGEEVGEYVLGVLRIRFPDVSYEDRQEIWNSTMDELCKSSSTIVFFRTYARNRAIWKAKAVRRKQKRRAIRFDKFVAEKLIEEQEVYYETSDADGNLAVRARLRQKLGLSQNLPPVLRKFIVDFWNFASKNDGGLPEFCRQTGLAPSTAHKRTSRIREHLRKFEKSKEL